ncbi:hypothetical protein AALA82_08470 [Oscillospiraceae bacterium 50-16]
MINVLERIFRGTRVITKTIIILVLLGALIFMLKPALHFFSEETARDLDTVGHDISFDVEETENEISEMDKNGDGYINFWEMLG